MNKVAVLFLLVAALIIVGCSSAPICDELAFYESATGGRRIKAPDDLDGLDELKEMAIPEASPRQARDLSAGCIDKPPILKTSESEDT
jgi:hypothetical protein